ncbi:hypothetical protein Nmel_013182 [Mimus melanotis]
MELLGNSGLCAYCLLQLLPRPGAVNSPPQGSLQQFLPWLPSPHCGLREKGFHPRVFASIKDQLHRSWCAIRLKSCRKMVKLTRHGCMGSPPCPVSWPLA